MSTPSTATATLPPHQQYYSHHQHTYPQPVANYHVNSQQLVNGSSRLGNSLQHGYTASNASPDGRKHTASTARTHQLPPITTPTTPADMNTAKKRERKPDWEEFYKNGLPKEVIVIDDDSPPPTNPRTAHRSDLMNGASASDVNGRHADKKRKTATSNGYDPVYQNPQASYSTTQTPYYDHSSSKNTISTDRTTSALNTTAATSLGSQASAGAYQPDNSVVGQKRKRTRKSAADEANEAKRQEIEFRENPFKHYVPPPDPPIKAREVNVPVIPDSKSHSKVKVDDDDGHYIVNPEADLTDKYQIVKLLGQGTFGKVVEAYDRRKHTRCAIKIIRSVQKYRDASRIELRVLSTLAQNDRTNRNKCIHLRDCFDFRNHICIVTDLYGQSVFDFLKSNQFVPFPNTHIQHFARQLLTSVAFLHDLHLIHTDLKPENILLVNNAYQTFTYNRTIPSSSTTQTRSARHRKVLLDPEIRLIDFGSATFNDEYHSSVVSTRHYRAPEIILNLGWSYPCDIWSIGCILVEFFTGDALFQTHDNLEHLAMMEPVCGVKIERELIRAVHRKEKHKNQNPATGYAYVQANPGDPDVYICERSLTKTPSLGVSRYFNGTKLDYPNAETPKTSKKYVKAMKKLPEVIPCHTEFNRQFLDLLKKIFVYNPDKRITAKQALQHPWFRETLQDDGTEAVKIRIEREKKAAQRVPQYR